MSESTITAGSSEIIVPEGQQSRVLLEIFSGDKGYLSPQERNAQTVGQRLDPGAFRIIESPAGQKSVLSAVNQDLTYQVTQLEPRERGQPGVAQPAPGGGGSSSVGGGSLVTVEQRAVTGQSPGANNDILGSDISLGEPGTIETRVKLASSATFRLKEGSATGNLNNGTALNGDAWYSFSINAQSNTGYNFRVGSAVTVDSLVVTSARSQHV